MRKPLLLSIFVLCLFSSCNDTLTNDVTSVQTNNPLRSRSAFDNYFVWDRINDIKTINPFTNTITAMGLPWKKGSSNNLGIPQTWLDENASDQIYADWELVYSNIDDREGLLQGIINTCKTNT